MKNVDKARGIYQEMHMWEEVIEVAEAKVINRVVKTCQIRHPEVRIRYPDTSEGSHRIASYI